jgi:single-strand DNA-binding protein
MNVVALVGNLATDPELRQTAAGRAVCSFRVAVSRPGGKEADFFSVVTWERQAEVCKQYLAVGRRVAIDGRLHHSTWEVEGERRSKVEVIAHRVEMLGKPRRDEPDVDFAPAAPVSSDPADPALSLA